ncbi:Hypothetical protein PBC10988_21680 [Planctomycetales bacterium 10988]|nr:Hypothetical protein PBC10988_21680 [Planctomycetales bacterium 10988]
MSFDPYYKWLGIAPEERPIHHYRLLGIRPFESDLDVIEAAADRQMGHLQTYKTGKHSDISQKLLNEMASAKICLLNPQKKSKYDAKLREDLQGQTDTFALGTTPLSTPSPTNAAGKSPVPISKSGSGSSLRLASPAESEDEIDLETEYEDPSGSNAFGSGLGSGLGMPSTSDVFADSGMGSKSAPNRVFQEQSTSVLGVDLGVLPISLKTLGIIAVGCIVLGILAGTILSFSGDEPIAEITPSGKVVFDWPDDERGDISLMIDGSPHDFPASGPLEVALDPGKHIVSVSRPGSKPYQETITLEENEEVSLPWQWEPESRIVLAWPESDRVGVQLEIDGEPQNWLDLGAVTTPEQVSFPLKAGFHTIHLTAEDGRSFVKEVNLAEGEEASLTPIFEVATVEDPKMNPEKDPDPDMVVAETDPPTKSNPDAINLLQMIDAARDRRSGLWKIGEDGTLFGGGGVLQIPYELPENFDLIFKLAWDEGADPLMVLLPTEPPWMIGVASPKSGTVEEENFMNVPEREDRFREPRGPRDRREGGRPFAFRSYLKEGLEDQEFVELKVQLRRENVAVFLDGEQRVADAFPVLEEFLELPVPGGPLDRFRQPPNGRPGAGGPGPGAGGPGQGPGFDRPQGPFRSPYMHLSTGASSYYFAKIDLVPVTSDSSENPIVKGDPSRLPPGADPLLHQRLRNAGWTINDSAATGSPQLLKLSPQGTWLVYATQGKFEDATYHLMVKHLETGEDLPLPGHQNLLKQARFSADERYLATFDQGPSGSNLLLWDLHTGSELQRLEGLQTVHDVAFSETGDLLVVTQQKQAVVYSMVENQFKPDRPPLIADGVILQVEISPEQQFALLSTESGELLAYDLNTSQKVKTFPLQDSFKDQSLTIGFLEEGTQVFCLARGDQVEGAVWDFDSQQELGSYQVEATFDAIIPAPKLKAFVTIARNAPYQPESEGAAPSDPRDSSISLWSLTSGKLLEHEQLPMKITTEDAVPSQEMFIAVDDRLEVRGFHFPKQEHSDSQIPSAPPDQPVVGTETGGMEEPEDNRVLPPGFIEEEYERLQVELSEITHPLADKEMNWGSINRKPIPSMEPREQARVTVQADIKDQAPEERSPEEHQKLAAYLLATAKQQEEDSLKYEYLLAAEKEAMAAGDARLALQALEQRVGNYKLDGEKLFPDFARKVANFEPKELAAEQLAAISLPLVQRSWEMGSLRPTGLLIEVNNAGQLAGRDDVVEVYTNVRELLTNEVPVMNAASTNAKRSLLNKDPNALSEREREELHRKVGLFLLCVQGDFLDGLLHLGVGSDLRLQAIARDDLAVPETVEEKLSLANRWWKMSQEVSPLEKIGFERRAVQWYRLLLSELSEEDRQLAEERIGTYRDLYAVEETASIAPTEETAEPSPMGSGGQASQLSFDGEDDYVLIPDLIFSRPDVTFTVEATITFSENAITGPKAILGNGTKSGLMLGLTEANCWEFTFYDKTGIRSIRSSQPAEPGERYHVAAVWDSRTIRLYVNGEVEETPIPTSSTHRPSRFPFTIGAVPDADGQPTSFFCGMIEDVRISNTVRYSKPFTPPKAFLPDRGTVALFQLNQGKGDKALDSTSRNQHGRILGATWK